MKAAFLTAPRRIEIGNLPEPRIDGARDVLVRIEAVGVCGSDMHYYLTGRIGSAVVNYPFILGHECAGTVLQVGAEVRRLHAGQRVAIDPLIACGRCDQCQARRRHTCRNQLFLGQPGQLSGALAEYVVLPEDCCHPVPATMTAEQAAMIEPLSIGVYAQRLSRMEPGAKIAILGSGPIGLGVLLACRTAAQCTVYVTDLIDERLRMATKLGSAWAGNPNKADVVKAILDAEPLGVDLVFECAGKQETIEQGVEMLKPGGLLLIVGIPEVDEIRFPIHTLRRNELTIINVRRQNDCMTSAIELVASGMVNVDPLMTHHFALEQTGKAFDLVAGYRDGVIKAMIHPATRRLH
jgi:L-iditol 2-dehydrogenase